MAKFKTNHVFGFKFYRLPISTQVMFLRIRQLVDRYARINYNTGVVEYSTKDKPKVKKIFTKAQALAVFNDLYPAKE